MIKVKLTPLGKGAWRRDKERIGDGSSRRKIIYGKEVSQIYCVRNRQTIIFVRTVAEKKQSERLSLVAPDLA